MEDRKSCKGNVKDIGRSISSNCSTGIQPSNEIWSPQVTFQKATDRNFVERPRYEEKALQHVMVVVSLSALHGGRSFVTASSSHNSSHPATASDSAVPKHGGVRGRGLEDVKLQIRNDPIQRKTKCGRDLSRFGASPSKLAVSGPRTMSLIFRERRHA